MGNQFKTKNLPAAPIKAPRKWRTWAKEFIWKDIVRLNNKVETMRRYFSVVKNKDIEANYHPFWGHARDAFLCDSIIFLFRCIEDDYHYKERRGKKKRSNPKRRSQKVLNLMVFLEEIRTHNDFFSRKRYIRNSVSTNYPLEIANKDFDRLVGENKPHLLKSTVNADIALIKSTTKELRKYRDKYLVHRALLLKSYQFKAKFDDIEKAVMKINKITNKYHQLITNGSTFSNFLTSNHSLTSIFSEPWLKSKSSIQKVKIEEDKSSVES